MIKFKVATVLILFGVAGGYFVRDNIEYFLPFDDSVPATEGVDGFDEVSLKCLPEEEVLKIRNSGSAELAYIKCKRELEAALNDDFGSLENDALKAIFSSVVAAQFAEYGNSSVFSYDEIKESDYLNCGNTILLSGYLYGVEKTNLRTIGFDGGAIGNHAQLYFDGDSRLLIDPTTGLVAKVGFDDLLMGVRVPREKIRVFSVKAKSIESFRTKVFLAVAEGKYRPSDFMYMHESVGAHLRRGSVDNYFTPGGIYIRDALRNQRASQINPD